MGAATGIRATGGGAETYRGATGGSVTGLAGGAATGAGGFVAASLAANAASFSRSISCFDFTKIPDGLLTLGGATGTSTTGFSTGAGGAGCLAANSSRKAEALMLSTVLETDFTSWAIILRSLRSAIISLLSKPSSSASLWMRMLMQQKTDTEW
jgi:hypothetical protein